MVESARGYGRLSQRLKRQLIIIFHTSFIEGLNIKIVVIKDYIENSNVMKDIPLKYVEKWICYIKRFMGGKENKYSKISFFFNMDARKKGTRVISFFLDINNLSLSYSTINLTNSKFPL